MTVAILFRTGHVQRELFSDTSSVHRACLGLLLHLHLGVVVVVVLAVVMLLLLLLLLLMVGLVEIHGGERSRRRLGNSRRRG